MRTRIVLIALFAIVPLLSQPALADSREEARLMTSAQVLQELMESPDQGVPTWLLDRAYAVVVVPSVIKIGFLVGGRRGKGVLVVRREDGSWSNPVFINLTGGSFGFQAGVQSTDVLLVFTSKAGIEGIVGGKLTLGADASVAAGPVGRQTGAATDIGLNAQVYSYSRASGLFAGVALDGSALTIDHSSNGAFYSKPGILASEILSSPSAVAPDAARRYITAVDHVTRTTSTSATPSSTATATQGTVPAMPSQPGNSGGALTTYPMSDPKPGSEPPQ
jgi:lipid-binding SYLF domain-containing protein